MGGGMVGGGRGSGGGGAEGEMVGDRRVRRGAARDRRCEGREAGEQRAEPGGSLPQLLRRAEAQSAAFVTSLLLGLRLSRWGIAGFSLVAFILTLIQTVGFYQIAGHTPAERPVFGPSMPRLPAEFLALFPPPLHPETVEGYVQFRGFSPLTILFAVWALASAKIGRA